MRGDRAWLLLKIIGRQPVLVTAYEGLEEGPCFPGKLSKEDGLVGSQPCFFAGQRPADPPGDSGREEPDRQQY